ncbi:MAG: VWA-like domain-containing protein, partial [Candidatus Calescibacterium sp.]|nr:VWA-like domain-containing protein [Candidatus Calescibacterium sp.]
QGFASRFMEESHSSEDSEGQEGHGAGQTEFEKAVDWYREQIRRGYGTSSSRILRGLADQLINSSVSKINWRELLKAYVQEFSSKKEQTFKRPNRRFALQGGLILPGKTRIPVISEPIVAVDVSGSVSDNWVRVGLQAAVEILSSEVASSVRVVQCDSEIVSEQLVTDPSEVDLGRHGAGGTSFAPPLARAEELGSPVVIYISEDLDGYFPPSCSVPVIWVTAPEAKVIPPFGVVVKVLAE